MQYLTKATSTIEETVRELIDHKLYEKSRKLLDKYHADLEGNVRLFLEEHMGIAKARDIDEPLESILKRMDLLDVHLIHCTVKEQPELNGIWIMKGNKPIVAFTDPRLEGNKIRLKKIMLDRSVYTVPAQ